MRIGFEQAVECRAADAELARGLEFVAVIQIEDEVDVVENNGVEVENLERGGRAMRRGRQRRDDREVFRTNQTIGRAEDGGFKDAGEFARVGGPVVLQQAGDGTGRRDGAVTADSVR